VIVLDKVTKTFGEKTAVKNLSLTVQKGEVFGFLGPNGAGKTTTMKMVLGLLKPTKGRISLFGEKAGSLAARKKIGFLPETAHFYQHLTGREFLRFVGEIFDIPTDIREKRIRTLLKQVHLPAEACDRRIGTYSKGMQQRIGMAQALINDPDVLFLDEPMSGLDPIGRREMKDIILHLKKEGKTVFFNSHILSDAEALCDRVAIIHNGQILVNDTVKNIVPARKTLEDVFVEIITGGGKTKRGRKTATKKSTQKKTSSATKKTASASAKRTSPSAKSKKVSVKQSKATRTKKQATTTKKKPGPKKKTIPALSKKNKK